MSAAGSRSGSARISRVGDGVTPSRTSVETNQTAGARYSRRRLPHFERAWAIYATTFTMRSGGCLSPKARTIVLDSWRHFHSQGYELFAACVMSDHVHLLLQPWPKNNDDNGSIFFWPVSDLMHSIKSFSAHKINELESKSGFVWQKEQFDRYVRSDRDLQEKFHYMLRHPWDAGVAKQNEGYPWIWTQHDEAGNESSFRRDSETSTRYACATQRRES